MAFMSLSASLYYEKRQYLRSCVYLDEVDSLGTSDFKLNFVTTSYYIRPGNGQEINLSHLLLCLEALNRHTILGCWAL